MSLRPSRNDREQDKFMYDSVLGTVVKTISKITGGELNFKSPTGPFLITVVTVGNSAVNPLPTPLTNRVSLSIRNKSTQNTVFFGTSLSVTADDTSTGGWEIGPGEDFNIDLDSSNVCYLISTANSIVKILEIASV